VQVYKRGGRRTDQCATENVDVPIMDELDGCRGGSEMEARKDGAPVGTHQRIGLIEVIELEEHGCPWAGQPGWHDRLDPRGIDAGATFRGAGSADRQYRQTEALESRRQIVRSFGFEARSLLKVYIVRLLVL